MNFMSIVIDKRFSLWNLPVYCRKTGLLSVVALAALWLTACAGRQLPDIMYIESAADQRRVIQSEVVAKQGSSQQSFLAVVEFTTDHTGIAALTPTGLSLFSAQWLDTTKSPAVQTTLLNTSLTDPDFVIPALMMTYLDSEAIKKLLPSGWSLTAKARLREFYFNDALVVEIKYPVFKKNPIELTHFNGQNITQKLTIETLH
ncbi:Uncharacterised protein [BD1-7 clade bacterium]|uniref:Outer-membrane lipoprotein LolB n=1 Tax=BD1-7 clade bacterium TaxID=2029982 RepID=A0A5S9QDI8_9GAMM|nr:Uncharacterised protein [BD1-7 clade bacterium]CAA0119060.1 Uncharacterised protein [BD1-7 clade bacterium]